MRRMVAGFIVMVLFLSLAGEVGAITSVSSCGTLDTPGATYVLSNDISATGTCFTITADDITLDGNGFTITGSGTDYGAGYGVYLSGRTGVTITNLTIKNFYEGINLQSSSNNDVINNDVISNGAIGIMIRWGSDNNNIIGNNVELTEGYDYGMGASYGVGIWVSSSVNNDILDNNVTNNRAGILIEFSSQNNIADNNASFNEVEGIVLRFNSNYNNVTNNKASMIRGNWTPAPDPSYIEYLGTGISIYNSSNNNIIDNIANSNCEYGIYLHNSNDNNIADNDASSNIGQPAPWGPYSICTGNGIYLSNSDNNNIVDNNVLNNTVNGISLLDSSNNNMIANNYVSSNGGVITYDICQGVPDPCSPLYYYMYGIKLDSSSNNLIYNNYFNNIYNFGITSSSSNNWNTTKTTGTNIIGGSWLGGNYWANPDGTGFSQLCTPDNDGICDLVYDLGTGNVDNLPLIGLDSDGDGVLDDSDNCPYDSNPPIGGSGEPVSFSHPGFGSDADCITPGVCLARGEDGPIYNNVSDSPGPSTTGPSDTEWAVGTCDSGSLSFDDFVPTSQDETGGYMPDIVGVDMCLHLISDDLYYDITFNNWAVGFHPPQVENQDYCDYYLTYYTYYCDTCWYYPIYSYRSYYIYENCDWSPTPSGGGFSYTRTSYEEEQPDDDSDSIGDACDADFTPVGTDVSVTLDGNTITFSNVDSFGTTTVTPTTPAGAPEKYKILGVGYTYEISTTATYSGTITLALSYDESDIRGQESNVRIFHYNETAGEWNDVTDHVDTVNNIVYAVVDHLSVFALAEPLDETPPTTSISLSGTEGSNDWYVSDVEVTLTATDNEGGTGVASTEYSYDDITWNTYTDTFTISDEGTTTVYYRSTDILDNVEETKTESLKVDKSSPAITGTRTPGPNANGWNNVDVTVQFDCSDGLSGVDSCPADSIVSTEGAGQSVTGTVTDLAGNSASTAVSGINIDKTEATVTVNTPVPYGLYTIGTALDFSATDSLSGVNNSVGYLTNTAGETTDVVSGFKPVAGVYTLVVSALDNADNIVESGPVFFVVYDPDGGFATGGGWFYTDSESTLPDGKANFGFVAKYKQGSSTGNLEFQYKDADINLKSTSIDWLVISAVSAQFQGTGTINREGTYTFRVLAKDNGEPGTGVDHFDIRIWEGTDTEADPYHKAKNTISGGNIKVHK